MKNLNIIILAFLTLSYTSVYGQLELENEIIASVINSEITPWQNDTIFRPNGSIKKINRYNIPDIVLIIDTEKPYSIDPKENPYNIFKDYGLSSLDLEAYYDFYNKNKTSIKITPINGFKAKIKYVSEEQITKIFDLDDWHGYYKKFGHKPMVTISRPGLNKNNDKAFIYYRFSRGGLSGYSYYLTLEKNDGIWIVKENKLGGIS